MTDLCRTTTKKGGGLIPLVKMPCTARATSICRTCGIKKCHIRGHRKHSCGNRTRRIPIKPEGEHGR